MQNPYNEGVAHRGVPGASVDDCPYSSALMELERAQWMRGFVSLQPVAIGFDANGFGSLHTLPRYG